MISDLMEIAGRITDEQEKLNEDKPKCPAE